MRANTIRKGHVIIFNNAPHRVIEFQHVTPGKGRAFMQTKLRNLLSGTQTETRFGASEDVVEADIFTFKASYLYNSDGVYCFMNSSTYEQLEIQKDLLGNSIYYLQENMEVDITLYNDNPIGINLPPSVILTIVETEPELRGATVSNSPKPALTDTGLQLQVPAFVKIGERIVVNTDEGSYISRAD